jgi:hypothetical protein
MLVQWIVSKGEVLQPNPALIATHKVFLIWIKTECKYKLKGVVVDEKFQVF